MTPQARRRDVKRRLRPAHVAVAVAAAVAVTAVTWAGIRIAARDNTSALGDSGDPGVSHVHGLGINPADDSLIVATHFGSFRLGSDKTARRIGGSFQDTMGFTVAGADLFYGSGHPDTAGFKRGQPPRLGLIESSDAGETWRELSLSGEVDFHGLSFAHDRVYGWDAGTSRFMVSSDRKEWTTQSTLDLFGFAVDPADGDRIVGANPAGLIESGDAGRTWNKSEGPALVALSWDATAGLWGADPGGVTWRRQGSEWQRAAPLGGEPEAFLATSDALYAAARDGESTVIYRSTDQGRTWQLRYRDA